MLQPPNPDPQFQPQQQWEQPSISPPQQWNPQQPPQQYQQLPVYQPQMLSQKKKSRKGFFIILSVILAVAMIGCIGLLAFMFARGQAAQQVVNQTSTQLTQLSTAQPATHPVQTTRTGTWTTVQTITGTGSKKTAIFTAPSDWKIIWSCSGKNVAGSTFFYVLAVAVFNANGTPNDPRAVQTICEVGSTKTTGEIEEHQGGQVYLSIQGSSDWTIQVQALK